MKRVRGDIKFIFPIKRELIFSWPVFDPQTGDTFHVAAFETEYEDIILIQAEVPEGEFQYIISKGDWKKLEDLFMQKYLEKIENNLSTKEDLLEFISEISKYQIEGNF